MPHVLFPTALGTCGLAWNDAGLTGFSLPEDDETRMERRLASKSDEADVVVALNAVPPPISEVIARVQRHLAGEPQDFADLSYDFSAVTEFQRRVYQHALTVKPGYTQTYGEIAIALQLEPGGARSVGTALGYNPWPLLVPCHRFVGADGGMTGYSGPGGVRTKTRLLALEGAQLLSE